jgi:hypothetical protein
MKLSWNEAALVAFGFWFLAFGQRLKPDPFSQPLWHG